MPKSKGSRKTAHLPAYIIESDQIGTPKEESLVMLTQFRADCVYPGPPESLSLRMVARISEELKNHYQPTDNPLCRLYQFSLTATSEILAGKRRGLPAFDFVASYVLVCQRRAVQDRPGRRDQGTTILAYWADIYAVHVAAAAADTAKAGTGKYPSQDALRSAGRRTAYPLPEHQQNFLLTHGPYAKVLLARAQLGHPHARYRVALLMATDPALADDATALLIDVASTGHPLALDLLDAVHETHAPAGTDSDAAGPLSRVAAQYAWDLGRAARDHGADEHAYAYFRAAARGGIRQAVFELSQMQLKKIDPEAAEWFAQLSAETAVGRHRTCQR